MENENSLRCNGIDLVTSIRIWNDIGFTSISLYSKRFEDLILKKRKNRWWTCKVAFMTKFIFALASVRTLKHELTFPSFQSWFKNRRICKNEREKSNFFVVCFMTEFHMVSRLSDLFQASYLWFSKFHNDLLII